MKIFAGIDINAKSRDSKKCLELENCTGFYHNTGWLELEKFD